MSEDASSGILDALFGADPDIQQLVLVSLIVGPTFLLLVCHLISRVTGARVKWDSNAMRRMQRQASDNVQMLFDSSGRVMKKDLDRIQHLELWTRVHKSLHLVTSVRNWIHPVIVQRLASLREARKACDEHWDKIQHVLSHDPPRALLNSLNDVDAMIKELTDRQVPTRDCLSICQRFVDECSKRMPRHGGKLLEPTERVQGISVRRPGILRDLVDVRDKFDIGSRRLVLFLCTLLLIAGPVRFLGRIPKLAAFAVLGLEIFVETLQLVEAFYVVGAPHWYENLRGSLYASVRRLVLFFIPVVFAMPWNDKAPTSNAELEDRFTFLPVPPQYQLEEFRGQQLCVSGIYGIMHAVLAILIIIPLPLCYGLQAKVVALCPALARVMPQNPVWLHRTLGYAMLMGLVTAATLWLVSMGFYCISEKDSTSCLAFNPEPGAGLDVFILRFYIVWPLTYFFIPFMVFSRYPDADKGKEAFQNPCKECLFKNGYFSPLSAFGRFSALLYKNAVDVCFFIIPLAGQSMAIKNGVNFPFWPMALAGVCFKLLAKLRTTLRAWLPSCCLKCVGPFVSGVDQGAELVDRCWWEVAYSLHVIAFSITLFFALKIRFEVFYPALPTWGLYFLDRLYGVYVSRKTITPIVVGGSQAPGLVGVLPHALSATGTGGGGTSSYVVASQKEGRVATHVRLVLQKPPGFKHKSGQWAHVAFPHGGSHWATHTLPFQLALPLQQWHAFSIASTEADDYLEFHVAVHGAQTLSDFSEVRVFPLDKHFVRVARAGSVFDWLCPHRVPSSDGSKIPATRLGCRYNAKADGAYLRLTKEGTGTVKTLKPQAQFTGRLWNAVQAMAQSPTSGSDRFVEKISLMGPYGTMPYMADKHSALMLIGAGVGFPSMGAMLRKRLQDDTDAPNDAEVKPVCFIWTATKLEQLILCFPSLLVDLAKYVQKKSLKRLQKWLTIKIFISSFESGDFLEINPSRQLFPEGGSMVQALSQVRSWLLHGGPSSGHDTDGTYIAQGSLGGSFSGIIRNSLFMKTIVESQRSLGICFCGPPDLCNWLRNDIANTIFPTKVEFMSECAA